MGKLQFLPFLVQTFLVVTLLKINNVIALEDSTVANSPSGIYTAVASKIISPYSTYNISVSVEHRKPENGKTDDAKAPLQFQAEIRSLNENYTTKEPVSILPGETGVISLQTEALTESIYNLTLKVKDGSKEESTDTVSIYPKEKNETILLIHTDKPVYKPGETVQFRVLLLNWEAKPFTPNEEKDYGLQVKIYDAEGNVIKIWDDAKTHTGLFSAKIELSSEPVLGDWNIEAKTKVLVLVPPASTNNDTSSNSKLEPILVSRVDESQTKSQSFAVDQYVLPKFKVTVKLPPFITFNDTSVPVHVQAQYTYGKGVKGDLTLVPKRQWQSQNEKIISSTFPIDGSTVKEIDIKHLFAESNYKYEQNLEFEAQVTENATGKSQNGTASVHMYQYPYKIEVSSKSGKSVKPGLPFEVVIKVLTQDNMPIHDPAPDALRIKHGFSYEAQDNHLNSSIPSDGTVTLKFATPSNDLNQATNIEVTYKELKYNYYVPQKYNAYSDSDINLKWQADDEKTEIDYALNQPTFVVNSKLQFNINATFPFSSFNYLLHGGRNELLEYKKINLPSPVKDYQLEISCPPHAPPETRIIVYIVNDKNEMLVDTLKFFSKSLEEHMENYLNISISDSANNSTFEPGQNITLKLDSRPNSLIALRGVDQSVLLLKQQDVDITQAAIDSEIQTKNSQAMSSHRFYGGSSAFDAFDEDGLALLTNAKIPRGNVNQWQQFKFSAAEALSDSAGLAGAPGPAHAFVRTTAISLEASRTADRSGGDNIRVRSKFPETWLWDEVALNGSNSFDLIQTIPDTLTSWIITGYSLNTEFGLGVLPQPQKVTIFRPFFISLNLPYSVVKGEVLVLQVLVHNYLPSEENQKTNATAQITLDNSRNQFQFNDKSLKDAKVQTKTVSCPPNEVTPVTFVIVPSEFGSIMLDVKGIIQGHMTMAGDALSQPLKVIPPGQQQRRTASALISTGSASNVNHNSMEATLTTIFPKKRVDGADHVKISFISDILGSTISNLDKMIQIPTGCGEQNMLNFVADIVILNYLNSTHNLDSKLKAKATNYLEKGYQRELTYRHGDGSFSAFGNSDVQGSTWLTAFVVRSFIQAQPHITIDDNIIKSALDFLANRQSQEGGLYEYGKVLSSQLQGGSGTGGLALTAYTVLAFIEASQKWDRILKQNQDQTHPDNNQNKIDYSSNIERGLNFISNLSKNITTEDPYALVLTTYALHLANHSLKDEYFDKLQASATQKGGLTFWEFKQNKSKTVNDTEQRPWEIVTKPVSVEMTGYALLTYILRGKVAESFPLVKWLLKERNANGGFHSTQDTVLGLTALAKYAELTKENVTNLKVKASYDSGDREVTVDQLSAEVLQEFELPQNTTSVKLAVSGTGTVLAQLMWSYYVEDEVPEPAFAVNVKTSSKSEDELELKICTSYLRGDQSNMAIVEVNLPSGYSVDTVETLGNLKDVPGYKRYDTENRDTKLEIYLDSITSNNTCIPVTALRSFKVGKQAPAFINVYDYYDTTQSARVFYEAPALSICDICKEDSDCPTKNNCL